MQNESWILQQLRHRVKSCVCAFLRDRHSVLLLKRGRACVLSMSMLLRAAAKA